MGATTTSASLATGLPGADASQASERIEDAARGLIEEAFATALADARGEPGPPPRRRRTTCVDAEALEKDDLFRLFGPRPTARRLDPRGALPA